MNRESWSTGTDESAELRRTALAAGIDLDVAPERFGIDLDSADDFVARMKAADGDPRRRTPRRLIIAVGSMAAAAAIALSVLQPWGSTPASADTPPLLQYEFAAADNIAFAPGKDSSDALTKLADAAAGQRVGTTAGQRDQHVVSDNWFAAIDDDAADKSIAVIPTIRESWVSPDGSQRFVERRGAPLAADGRGLPNDGAWSNFPASTDETQPPGSVDATMLERLPKNQSALRPALLKVSGCDQSPSGPERARCLFTHIDTYSNTYVVPARVMSALWSLLSEQTGPRLLGAVKDRAGREGVGIAIVPADRANQRLVLIASPKTGQLLGFEVVLIKPDANLALKAPAILRFSAFLAAEHTDPTSSRSEG
ncbi:CU044_5270 family protein [Aeromicrobium ginsengisoli]|uniref:CU044_5270 family protein n=1 Tax=Aeromicrobium ginsengisoli TaxID=363867 RepID=A0A5M4FH64_9ACTN|nr:CU044_5270 family protein [Aeromicrobium ginsengisoli]KAA1399579.1 hypothetical protein ESP70_002095 [Aeromicrobium ginsengisoli]